MASACQLRDHGVERLLVEGQAVTVALAAHQLHKFAALEVTGVKGFAYCLCHDIFLPRHLRVQVFLSGGYPLCSLITRAGFTVSRQHSGLL